MSDISKLAYPYFTDGTTNLNASNLNPIIAKINDIIDKVNSDTPAPTGSIVISTAVDTGLGTISGGGNYNDGDTVTLQATATTGYDFVSWGDAASNPRTVTASENKTYHGAFIPTGGTVINYSEKQNHVQSLKSANSASAIVLSYVSANYNVAFYPITAGKKYEIVTKCLHNSVMVWGYCNSIPSSFPGSSDSPITLEGKMISDQPVFVNGGCCAATIESAENFAYLVLITPTNDFYTKVKQMN